MLKNSVVTGGVAALAAATALTAAAPATAAKAKKCTPANRVVSLSPTATEMLFAIGAGPRVVAVDDQSNYPAKAPRTKLSGYKANAEAVLKYRPRLVVVQADSNNLVAGLRAAKVRVLVQPAAKNLNQSYAQIRQLGALTCRQRQAATVIVKMKRGVTAAVRSVPAAKRTGTYFHELDSTLYAASSTTFIGSVYARFGLTNIADPADTGTGYPQLSGEAVIAANPAYIFLADAGFGESAATVAKRPGWANVAAVRNGRVIAVNADVASRWGPRVVVFARQVAKALNAS